MQNFCGKCGSKLSGNNEFCTNCGAKVVDEVESKKDEIKKVDEIAAKSEIRTEKKDNSTTPSNTKPSSSQDQALDPKIKKISILVGGLFIALLIAGAVFNFPINSSVSFDYENGEEIKAFSELRDQARKIAREENSKIVFQYVSIPELAEIMIARQKDANKEFPIADFSLLWKTVLLVFILIIITFALNELIKEPNKLKWAIIFLILIVGIGYSFLMSSSGRGGIFGSTHTNSKYLFSFIGITISIFLCLLSFYNKKEIKKWIVLPMVFTILGIFFGAFSVQEEALIYYIRAQMGALIYYLLVYLYVASTITFSTVTFYLFLKEFIYEPSPELYEDSTMKVYSKEQYNDFRDRLLGRK